MRTRLWKASETRQTAFGENREAPGRMHGLVARVGIGERVASLSQDQVGYLLRSRRLAEGGRVSQHAAVAAVGYKKISAGIDGEPDGFDKSGLRGRSSMFVPELMSAS